MFRDRVHKRKPATTAQQEGTLDVHHAAKLQEFDTKIRALRNKPQEPGVEAAIAELEKARLDYWDNTFDILTKYYRMCESDDPVPAAPIPAMTPSTGKKMSALPGQKSLLQFITQNHAPPQTPASNSSATPATTDDREMDSTAISSRCGLLREYMMVVDPTQVKPLRRDRSEVLSCPCCKVERVVIEADGVAICPKCGSQDVVLVESDRVAVGTDSTKDYSSQSYRRVNHLSEHLAQVQGRETTVIPEALIDSVMLELKKERVSDMRNITPKMMRGILKRLGSSKYYEHITTIIRIINGQPPLRISPELEDKIKAMFKEVQPAFSRVCPTTRSNFLQYNYVISRILLLLNEPELASYFPPLKSREKQAMAESTWKAICADLGWPFMPSI